MASTWPLRYPARTLNGKVPLMLMVAALLLVLEDYVPDPDCQSQANILRIETKPARQGATLSIEPRRYYDLGERDLADKCIARWTVSDPASVALAADHRSATIAPEAVPGTIVTISYSIGNTQVAVALRIVARDTPDLTGIWRQTSLLWCGGTSLGELAFRSDGTFAATAHPFETSTDHRGFYRWDPATQVLILDVRSGGEHRTVRGLAAIDAQGALHISGISFERMIEAKSCRHVFR